MYTIEVGKMVVVIGLYDGSGGRKVRRKGSKRRSGRTASSSQNPGVEASKGRGLCEGSDRQLSDRSGCTRTRLMQKGRTVVASVGGCRIVSTKRPGTKRKSKKVKKGKDGFIRGVVVIER